MFVDFLQAPFHVPMPALEFVLRQKGAPDGQGRGDFGCLGRALLENPIHQDLAFTTLAFARRAIGSRTLGLRGHGQVGRRGARSRWVDWGWRLKT